MDYKSDIETYGYFNGTYVKLSDELIKAIQFGIKDYLETGSIGNAVMNAKIIQSRELYYSKKLHGDMMLRNINPDIVSEKCRRYFQNAYYQIKQL